MIVLCMCLCKAERTLTKLYPGTDCSNRDVIDLLQVVFYVILGHSVQTCPEQDREEKNTNRKKEGEKVEQGL